MEWIRRSGRLVQFPIGLRSVFVGATIQIALEHHASIVSLMERGSHASALTLLRPLFEESTRSSWLLRVASDEQLVEFGNGKLKPGLESMVRSVARHHRDNSMLTILKPAIDRMHGYTHGGMDHLQHRFHEGNLQASYPSNVLCDALMVANLYAIMAFLEGPAIAPDIPLGDRLYSESRKIFGLDKKDKSPG